MPLTVPLAVSASATATCSANACRSRRRPRFSLRRRCRTTWPTPGTVLPGEIGRMCRLAPRQSGHVFVCPGCAMLLRPPWGQQDPALASPVLDCSLRHFLTEKVRMSQNEGCARERQRLQRRRVKQQDVRRTPSARCAWLELSACMGVRALAFACVHSRTGVPTCLRICTITHARLQWFQKPKDVQQK